MCVLLNTCYINTVKCIWLYLWTIFYFWPLEGFCCCCCCLRFCFSFISLIGRVPETERERCSVHWFNSPDGHNDQDNAMSKPGVWNSILVSHMTIICCFCRHIFRERSRWDSDWSLYGLKLCHSSLSFHSNLRSQRRCCFIMH